MIDQFANPYRPGAGHPPPFLAGRDGEVLEYRKLLEQDAILENAILTGLRGVGKTVLLDTAFKTQTVKEGWLWVGTDLSETASVSEMALAIRVLTDLAVVASSIAVDKPEFTSAFGFSRQTQRLNYDVLGKVFQTTPGLVADKLKAVLRLVWEGLEARGGRGIVFAYDEAQNLRDHSQKDQYPLSMLLDVFQSIQKVGIPFMLVLTGLPTLFPQLVEARTFSERMFRVIFLDRLNERDSRDAIVKPIEATGCPVRLSKSAIDLIVKESSGYPYFVQFICREVYDAFLQELDQGGEPIVPMNEILRKLDTDFFAGRWHRATDRQRELLWIIANLASPDEFTVQEIVILSTKLLGKPFSNSHANQMLASLSKVGLVYKNRHGKYSFAVPLLGQYIIRQHESE